LQVLTMLGLHQDWPGEILGVGDEQPEAEQQARRASAYLEDYGVKAAIVQADEREANERRKLNFGHTLGHALEKTRGLRHGEAVACGMVLASRISAARGTLAPDDAARIERLLASSGLPTTAAADPESLMEAIRRDKKRDREDVLFVCLASIGRAEIIRLSYRELGEYIHDLYQRR